MASVAEHLSKLREERQAREKARIEKLREINLKKYNKNEPLPSKSMSNISVIKTDIQKVSKNIPKNNLHLTGLPKRPITAPVVQKKNITNKSLTANNLKIDNTVSQVKKFDVKQNKVTTTKNTDAKNQNQALKVERKPISFSATAVTNNVKTVATKKFDVARKSLAPKSLNAKPKPVENSRKSMLPRVTQSATKPNPNRQSVFERLYQPKIIQKNVLPESQSQKLQTDPNYLKKVIKNTGLILNRRHTLFEAKKTEPVRRSISAVHLKRISQSELGNCIHKWASIGEKIDKLHLKNIDEDASVKEDKVVSAVKSERKRVKFMTPVPANFNTPRPEELQSRLQKWLQKRGKSLDSFHHLQCFGIHLAQKDIKPVNLETEKFDEFDDDDKENQPLDSDSDNDSFKDNMNNKTEVAANDKWRRASYVSDSVDFNETADTTLTSADTQMHHVDELLLGALNDLTDLLRENYEWEQCARWLRAVRSRFPSAVDTAAYWECRAALEERRGDLPASVHCWEEAIAKGTERSVVEANLDQLLTKFMQLKISPTSGREKQVDQKMVDVKNVFKSTLIRFAVQQAKLRQSQEPPKYTVTPVRRSGRLSQQWSSKRTPSQRTPLQVCSSVRQAGMLGHSLVFVPNDKLCGTP